MTLTTQEWHARYRQQARWTADLRDYLFQQSGLREAQRVVEVGCGTSAVLTGLAKKTSAALHGLDICPSHLALAEEIYPEAHFTVGDAHHLSYPAATFDVTFCHFLLLWVADPVRVVEEFVRITRPRGAVLALAEPDYGGRIDYPGVLTHLGYWQAEALRKQGADPEMGRKLAGLLSLSGLEHVEAGVLGGRWSGGLSQGEVDAEWALLREDLGDTVPLEELDQLYEVDRKAWARGERILYVPTFYAWGRVPG